MGELDFSKIESGEAFKERKVLLWLLKSHFSTKQKGKIIEVNRKWCHVL